VRITRPGKAGEGHSGNIWTGVDGDAIATIFSTDWPVIGPKTPTEPQSWALDPIGILRHPGDPRSGVSIPAAAITTEVGDYQEGLEYIDWSKTQQPADDLVERLIIPHRWVQFIAPAKAGKSSLEMFIAIELSEGREPFEQSSVTPVPTIWLDGEMGETDLAELIDACGHDPAQLPNLHCSTNHPRLDSPLGAQRLLKDVDRWNARLVIVDGLNSFIQPEKSENDTNTWLPFFQHTVVPLKARGVALLSGDNMGKEEERGARGSSAKNDKADAVIHIKPDRQGIGVTLKAIHSRGGAYIDQPLKLAAEGFDRSTHIRYWRASLSWPAGTSQAVKVLDDLQVPFDMGRSKVRETLIAAGKTMSNEVLAAAIRWRKANILPQGTSGGLTTSQTRTGVRTVLVRDGQVLQTDPDNVP
jgi:hypothetical protein